MKSVPSVEKTKQDKIRLSHTCKGVIALRKKLNSFCSVEEKVGHIKKFIDNKLQKFPQIEKFLSDASDEERLVILLILALDQEGNVFANLEEKKNISGSLSKLAEFLLHTERFYSDIGGLLGYYETVLRLFSSENVQELPELFPPPLFDMKETSRSVWEYVFEATRRLEEMAELFTVGGAGERLGLVDEKTGEPRPVAGLVFCGKTVLEGLFRDVESREYWHYRVYGKQIRIPVVLMTSREKNNDQHVSSIVERALWYGRAPDSIYKVVQPLAPLATDDGQLACSAPLEMMGRPGGHGVVWKLAADQGIFSALKKKGVSSLLVRQINNPLAGLDFALLSLQGVGLCENKSFGFVGCPPRPGFAEGLIALVVEHNKRGQRMARLANIEYTEFERVRKQNPSLLEEGGVCPANTNILFARIEAIEKALCVFSIPGVVINAKTKAEVIDGNTKAVKSVARLESAMQNITDGMADPIDDNDHVDLSTFVNLYDRAKVMSVTKRPCADLQNPYETPVSCFYDWYGAAYSLLQEHCRLALPRKQSFEQFIAHGPNVLFFFNPSLGPLWDVIAQKIQGGRIVWGSEVELEIAELCAQNLEIDGSFRLLCERPTGEFGNDGLIHFSENVPKACLKNVSIENQGLIPAPIHSHIQRSVSRFASCTIQLEEESELVAEDIVIRGDFSLTVPKGKRVRLSQGKDGQVEVTEETLDKPSWRYNISWAKGEAPTLTRVLL